MQFQLPMKPADGSDEGPPKIRPVYEPRTPGYKGWTRGRRYLQIPLVSESPEGTTPEHRARVHALTPWSATLRRAVRRHRLRETATASEAAAAAKALSPLETYHLVKEVGAADAASLLVLLEPDQVRALVDLDVWRDHELDASDLLLWLQAFREASVDSLTRAVRAIDPEAVALFLHARLEIALRSPEDEGEHPAESVPEWVRNPGEDLEPVVETPDGRFWIAARPRDRMTGRKVDEEERKAVLSVVDELFRDESWEEFAGLLRLAHDELGHGLAEDAYRFRLARLEDLGFPPLERAFEVYGRLDPSHLAEPPRIATPANDAQLPQAYVAPLDRGLFAAAMHTFAEPQVVRRIEGDLVPFANTVLVADGIAPADLAGVQTVLSATRGFIDVALAHDTTPEDRLETARHRLRHQHISALFRVGHGLALDLKTRARTLRDTSAFALGDDPFGGLDAASRSVVEALLLRRPRVSSALDPLAAAADRAGETLPAELETGRHAPRPFELPGDVPATDRVLSDLEDLSAWLRETGWVEQAARFGPTVLPVPPARNVETLFTTAVANALLSRGAVVSPLTPADLDTILRRPEFGATSDAYATRAGAAFEGAPPAVWARVLRACRAWADAVGRETNGETGAVRGAVIHVPETSRESVYRHRSNRRGGALCRGRGVLPARLAGCPGPAFQSGQPGDGRHPRDAIHDGRPQRGARRVSRAASPPRRLFHRSDGSEQPSVSPVRAGQGMRRRAL